MANAKHAHEKINLYLEQTSVGAVEEFIWKIRVFCCTPFTFVSLEVLVAVGYESRCRLEYDIV
jgi:hypothetical protein